MVPFVLDPDAITEINDPIIANVIHRAFITLWRNYGALVYSEKDVKNKCLVDAIKTLPQQCKVLWTTALGQNPRRVCNVWDGSIPNSDLAELRLLSTHVSVIFLDSARSVVLANFDESETNQLSMALGGMEICRFPAAAFSKAFINAAQLSTTPLKIGESNGHQFSLRYASYLTYANHVTVVDRYILRNHLDRNASNEVSGLDRLFRACEARPSNRRMTVKIYTAIEGGRSGNNTTAVKASNEFISLIKARYLNDPIRDIQIYICLDHDFRKEAHARYIRCDHHVFGMDAGLDCFGGDFSTRADIFWKRDWIQDKEIAMVEASLATSAFVVS